MTLAFDWDGTLHNTLRLYGKAFRIACQELVEEGHAPGGSGWIGGFPAISAARTTGSGLRKRSFPIFAVRFPGPYVVIGDRESDFRAAQVHGLKSIGCAYGFGTEAELRMADFVVLSCGEIPDFIMDR